MSEAWTRRPALIDPCIVAMNQWAWEQPPRHPERRPSLAQVAGVEFNQTFNGCTWKVLVGGHEESRESAQVAAARFIESLSFDGR